MIRTLKNRFHKLSRGMRALIIGLAVLAVPAMVMAYGPERPTFDWNKFDASKSCTDPANANGQCGSMTGPVFNSFTNIPAYGNELNFNSISQAVDTNPVDDNFQDKFTGVKSGQEYWVRMYVHNDANQSLNCAPENRIDNGRDCSQIDAGSPGIATNTTVRLDFDKGRAIGHDIKAYVKSGNATPTEVYDDAQLHSDNNSFRMEYVPGSAFALTAKQNTVRQPLSDDIAGAGVALGQDFSGNINGSGNFPGCSAFITRVYVKIRVKAPVLKIEKFVKNSATQRSEDSVGQDDVLDGKTIAPDTQLSYKVRFFNTGNDDINDLTIRDTLPKGVKLVPNSLKLWTEADNTGRVQGTSNEDVFFNQGGLNTGNYRALTDREKTDNFDNGMYTFKATIDDNKTICELSNVAYVRGNQVDEIQDDSVVYVDRNGAAPGNGCNETPPVTSFKCDGLTVSLVSGRTYRFTIAAKLQGNVSVNAYVLNFGDGTSVTVPTATSEHTYANAGSFTATAKVVTTAGTSQDVCQVSVVVPTTPVTPPATPAVLPKTGTGGVVGVFATVSVVGALAHRYLLGRRYQ